MKRNTVRDNLIRDVYKKGDGGWMAKGWHVSRQRIWQIVHDSPQKPPNRNLVALVSKVIHWVRGLLK